MTSFIKSYFSATLWNTLYTASVIHKDLHLSQGHECFHIMGLCTTVKVLSHQFYPCNAMVLAMAVSVHVCLSQVGTVSKQMEQVGFWHEGFLPAPCCKKILVSSNFEQWIFVPNSELIDFFHHTSILQTCAQQSPLMVELWWLYLWRWTRRPSTQHIHCNVCHMSFDIVTWNITLHEKVTALWKTTQTCDDASTTNQHAHAHLKNSRQHTLLTLFFFSDSLKPKMCCFVTLCICTNTQVAGGHAQASCLLESLQHVTKLHQRPLHYLL